jgi:hypothetical protein
MMTCGPSMMRLPGPMILISKNSTGGGDVGYGAMGAGAADAVYGGIKAAAACGEIPALAVCGETGKNLQLGIFYLRTDALPVHPNSSDLAQE